MDAVLALERYELLYEAGLIDEAERDDDGTGVKRARANKVLPGSGVPLYGDHRRIMATALGRLRGKLAYRPVVFELLPGELRCCNCKMSRRH